MNKEDSGASHLVNPITSEAWNDAARISVHSPPRNAKLLEGSTISHLSTYPNANLNDRDPYSLSGQAPSSATRSRIFMTTSLLGIVAKFSEGLSKELDADYGVARKTKSQNMAQDVVDNELQWVKIKQAMKEKGAVTGLSLKHNLQDLLNERFKELEQEKEANNIDVKTETKYRRSLSLG